MSADIKEGVKVSSRSQACDWPERRPAYLSCASPERVVPSSARKFCGCEALRRAASIVQPSVSSLHHVLASLPATERFARGVFNHPGMNWPNCPVLRGGQRRELTCLFYSARNRNLSRHDDCTISLRWHSLNFRNMAFRAFFRRRHFILPGPSTRVL